MIVGLWISPAVLGGLFALLWVTTCLESLIAPTTATRPAALGMAGAGSAPSLRVGPDEGRSQPCT